MPADLGMEGSSPRFHMLQCDVAQPLRVHSDAMPLDGAPIGVLPRVLVVQRPPIVPNPAGAQGEESHRPPALQELLHGLLPHLPHENRLPEGRTRWEVRKP